MFAVDFTAGRERCVHLPRQNTLNDYKEATAKATTVASRTKLISNATFRCESLTGSNLCSSSRPLLPLISGRARVQSVHLLLTAERTLRQRWKWNRSSVHVRRGLAALCSVNTLVRSTIGG